MFKKLKLRMKKLKFLKSQLKRSKLVVISLD